MTLCKQFTSDIWNSFVLKGACSFIWESNVVLLTPELWLCKHGCPYSIHNSEVSLFGAFVDPLWKKPITKSKGKGLGAQPQKRPHLVYLVGSNKSSNELGYLNIEVDGKTSWRCCVRRLTRCFMRTVQQNVFLILNRVPVTYVTDPELIRPSIPVMTHSFVGKVRAVDPMGLNQPKALISSWSLIQAENNCCSGWFNQTVESSSNQWETVDF